MRHMANDWLFARLSFVALQTETLEIQAEFGFLGFLCDV